MSYKFLGKNFNFVRKLFLLCSVLFLFFGRATFEVFEVIAATLRVPEDYPKIQAAIDAAQPDDTVLVAPGYYIESIRLKSDVTLKGSGANATTIKGDGGSVVDGYFRYYTVLGANNSTISGFTITVPAPSRNGILNWKSSPTIINNILTGCSNAGIYNYGCSPTVVNNLIIYSGIGIRNRSSSPMIVNNTIFSNYQGITNVFFSSPIITNNIINGNSYGIWNLRTQPESTNAPLITYNDIWGNWANYTGLPDQNGINGNISANPLFVDQINGDYHLGEGSPCIDAGTNDAPGLPETDFDGKPRIVDGNNDGIATIDMGVFEYGIVDKEPPEIVILSPEIKDYLHSDNITLSFSATDEESGVAMLTASLDDTAVSSGQMIDLFSYSLGEHTLLVKAEDKVGNKAEKSVNFKVIATIDSLVVVKERCFELGWIDNSGIRTSLDTKLENAKKKIDTQDYKTAGNILNAFLNEVKAQTDKHITPEAANILSADGNYVLEHFPKVNAAVFYQMSAGESINVLGQNYPNPFNPATTIEYSVAQDCQVTIKLYNAAGQEVATIVDEYQSAGLHKIIFDAGDKLSRGIYYYQLKAGDFVDTKKMVVLK